MRSPTCTKVGWEAWKERIERIVGGGRWSERAERMERRRGGIVDLIFCEKKVKSTIGQEFVRALIRSVEEIQGWWMACGSVPTVGRRSVLRKGLAKR